MSSGHPLHSSWFLRISYAMFHICVHEMRNTYGQSDEQTTFLSITPQHRGNLDKKKGNGSGSGSLLVFLLRNAQCLEVDLSRMPAVKAVKYFDNDLGDLVCSYLKHERRGVSTFLHEGLMESVCSNSKSL